MSLYPPKARPPARAKVAPGDAILKAVMDDVRTTLRMAWVDPAIRGLVSRPEFFTAAWSATRPNVTRSFATGAEALRRSAAAALEGPLQPPARRLYQGADLSSAERDRLVRAIQAVAHSAPKVQLVIQAWAVLARRHRIPGTGREEPPAKRGIPDWQQGLVGLPRSVPPEVEALLDEATVALGVAVTPSILRALAPWPGHLERAWRDLREVSAAPEWRQAITMLRRSATDVLRSLPHPMDLQWDVLVRRGVTEEQREALSDHLTALAAAMPVGVLAAAYVAASFGAYEGTAEGVARPDRAQTDS